MHAPRSCVWSCIKVHLKRRRCSRGHDTVIRTRLALMPFSAELGHGVFITLSLLSSLSIFSMNLWLLEWWDISNSLAGDQKKIHCHCNIILLMLIPALSKWIDWLPWGPACAGSQTDEISDEQENRNASPLDRSIYPVPSRKSQSFSVSACR